MMIYFSSDVAVIIVWCTHVFSTFAEFSVSLDLASFGSLPFLINMDCTISLEAKSGILNWFEMAQSGNLDSFKTVQSNDCGYQQCTFLVKIIKV